MKIGGFIKNSFVDYPSNICSVIFTVGCNYNCWYCHNQSLLHNKNTLYEFDKICNFLKTRVGRIDGVVFSGGEPTLQPDLEEKIKIIKDLGFKIKLDTNGTNPEILSHLLDENLLDYVAMDIKNSFTNYAQTVQLEANVDKISKSIEMLIASNIDYEFRTTFSPEISLQDIQDICQIIKGCKNYYLQKYIPLKINNNCHSLEEFSEAIEIARRNKINAHLRSL